MEGKTPTVFSAETTRNVWRGKFLKTETKCAIGEKDKLI
jgi:hypothetical protein